MHSAKRVRNIEPEESSSAAAEVMASNDDLLSELLLRLPIKSLLKFKCVCKQWLSLITDPHFTRRKHLMSYNAVSAFSGVFSQTADNPSFRYELVPVHPLKGPLTSLTFVDPPHHDIDIISSCKGLLLCSSSLMYSDKTCESKYYIYNPTTMQSRSLPPPCVQAADVQVMGFCLAFDPPKSPGYKIACIRRSVPSYDHCQILVYSSETGGWRVSGAPFPLSHSVSFPNGVYWNGGIYWVNELGASLCFDLKKKRAHKFPIPPRCMNSVEYFGESGGHLHLIYRTKVIRGCHPPVYEMKRDGSGWFEKFQIDLDLSRVVSANNLNNKGVLCMARGEKREDSFIVIRVPGKVIRYNFGNMTHQVIYYTISEWISNTSSSERKVSEVIQCDFSKKTCEVIGKTHAQTRCIGWPFVHQFMESLAPV